VREGGFWDISLFFAFKSRQERDMVDYLRVGVITSPHGIRGEVKVFPTTDDVNRFKKLKKAFIDTGRERLPVTVSQARFFKNMVILKIKEFEKIEDCEPYRNKDLLVARDQAVALAPDENFIADLIGLRVITEDGEAFGEVKDIMKTGANDVYVITGTDGKEYLFPSIKECIREVNLENGTVTVHIMDGLLDL
jgi:16S rRNA processing protein RimM